MTVISIKEARQNFGELVSAAERGESVLITRRGRKVARLGPVDGGSRRRLPSLAEFRTSLRIKGKSLSRTLLDARRRERY